MNWTHLRASAFEGRPWKNGGGVTHEIACCPRQATLDSFVWRLSMAEVAQPGPFSTFEGVDRLLAVLDGTLLLRLEGREAIALTSDSEPLAFSGEAPCVGEPGAGVATDLNVMTRRGRASAAMRRISGAAVLQGDVAVIFALEPARVLRDGPSLSLGRRDALRVEAAHGRSLTIEGGDVLLIEIKTAG